MLLDIHDDPPLHCSTFTADFHVSPRDFHSLIDVRPNCLSEGVTDILKGFALGIAFADYSRQPTCKNRESTVTFGTKNRPALKCAAHESAAFRAESR